MLRAWRRVRGGRPIAESDKVKIIGLGCTEEDLSMLSTVDMPIIIPTSTRIAPCFSGRNWQIAKDAGVAGWIKSIKQISNLDL